MGAGIPKSSFQLKSLSVELAICRLPAHAPVPSWVLESDFFSITRTGEELSVVCPAGRVPPAGNCSAPWRALQVEGPMDLSETGVLATLAEPLARARVPLFALSTFDTDFLLVPAKDLDAAIRVLEEAGHRVCD
jgi:hypothetical protein